MCSSKRVKRVAKSAVESLTKGNGFEDVGTVTGRGGTEPVGLGVLGGRAGDTAPGGGGEDGGGGGEAGGAAGNKILSIKKKSTCKGWF